MQLDFKGKWNVLLVRNSIPCPLWVSNFKFAFQRFVSPPRRKPRLPQDYVPRPNYAAEIWKRCFHSKSASNVFCPHYPGEIWKRNIHGSLDLDLCLIKTLAGKLHHYLGLFGKCWWSCSGDVRRLYPLFGDFPKRGYTSTGRAQVIHPQTSSLSEQHGTDMHEGQLPYLQQQIMLITQRCLPNHV